MARARHAQRSRGSLIIGVVVAVVVAAGVLALYFTQRNPRSTATPQPQTPSSASGSASSPTSAGSSASETAGPSTSPTVSPTVSPSPTSASSTSTAAAAAQRALTACRARVEAGDAVLASAAVADKHWSEHVQAQTLADHGSISLTKMKATWKKTKLAGPDDIRRYDAAVRKADGLNASCASTSSSAPRATADQLASCQQRLAAQTPMRSAAADVVKDWRKHLSDMRRSAAGIVPGPKAQQIWLSTWRHAPKDLNAYTKAEKTYQKAPTCT